jgi:hypothetical protein
MLIAAAHPVHLVYCIMSSALRFMFERRHDHWLCTVQVARVGRLHFQKQQGLGFLKDAKLADAEIHQLPQTLNGQQADWVRAAASIELVWLHFAIHKYYHGLK